MSARVLIDIDPESCVGSGVCVALARDVFELDPAGTTRVKNPDGAIYTDILEAAEGCPTMAIRVRDAATGEILFP